MCRFFPKTEKESIRVGCCARFFGKARRFRQGKDPIPFRREKVTKEGERTMKKSFAVFTLLLPLAAAVCGNALDVRDFGAKGDGRHDDAPAFRKAFKEAFVRRTNNNTAESTREIFIPAGRYRLGSTLVFRNNLVLRGEKGTVLWQEDPRKDLLYGHSARFGLFENITFEGGKNHLLIWTENNDASIFTVNGCRFLNASSFAVKCFSFATGGGVGAGQRANIKLIPPYAVTEKDGVETLTPQDLSRKTGGPGEATLNAFVPPNRRKDPRNWEEVTLKAKYADCFHFFNSTKILLEDSVFENCGGAIACETDGTTVRRCRVVTRPDTELPSFLLGNRTTLAELDILVRGGGRAGRSVVEMRGSRVGAGACLDFHDSVVRTDDGRGVCLVAADMSEKTYFAQSILLQRLSIESAGCPENAVVYFRNNVFANIVMLAQIRDTGKGRVRAVGFETEPDEKSIRRSYPLHYINKLKTYTPEQTFAFSFAENSENIDPALPESLKKLERKLPYLPEKPEKIAPKLTFPGKVFYAKDHGVGLEPGKNDSAALQKLLDLAGKTPGSTVVLPARKFMLEETLRVPENLHITSSGMAHLVMRDPGRDIFLLHSPRTVRFSKLILSRGRSALHVKAPAGHKGRIELDTCCGFDFERGMVHAFAGKTLEDGKNLELYFHDGVWQVETAYTGNLHAVIDNLWLESKRYGSRLPLPVWVDKQSVVFVNFGRLQLSDMLGVPLIFRQAEHYVLPPKGTPKGEYRWVDNFGDYASYNCRYGTEFFGHSLVYHYGRARTRIFGGFGGFQNERARKYPGLADTPDADFCAVNLVCMPYNRREHIALLYMDETGKVGFSRRQAFYNIVPDTTLTRSAAENAGGKK